MDQWRQLTGTRKPKDRRIAVLGGPLCKLAKDFQDGKFALDRVPEKLELFDNLFERTR
jgi:hypothetical protein